MSTHHSTNLEPFSFYGLGTVSLASSEKSLPSGESFPDYDLFEQAIPVAGDETGIFLIRWLDSDNSGSGETEELLNVLAARITRNWAAAGWDVLIGTPRELDETLRKRLKSQAFGITNLWNGKLEGANAKPFVLIYASHRRPVSGETLDEPLASEDAEKCSANSLDS